MIFAGVSSVQLDTIDADEIAAAVKLSRDIDKLEGMAAGIDRTGLALVSLGRAFALILGCNAPQGDRATIDRHVLTLPAFQEMPRFNFARDVLPNPRAPIPEHIRRRTERHRWR